MARKIVTEQDKKKAKKKKIILIILAVLVIIGIGVTVYLKYFKKESNNPVEVQILDQNEDYGYSLSDRDGELYKEEYNKLKEIIEADDVDTTKYATQVAKMFVIDLYSIDTKLNMYDIGGSEFYYADKKDMFDKKVMDTLYSTVEDDTYGDRKQDLPMVKSIDVISTEETKYSMNDKKVDAYSVKLEWTYESSMGYDDEGTVVVAKEDGIRWSVVDYQPTLSPEYE